MASCRLFLNLTLSEDIVVFLAEAQYDLTYLNKETNKQTGYSVRINYRFSKDRKRCKVKRSL